MSIIYDALQFIETSLLFSAFLFTAIMFIKTRDVRARRNLLILVPVSALQFISYMYSINVRNTEIDAADLSWLSPLFALVVIALIMAAIFAACYYVIKIFPISAKRKRNALVTAAFIVGALLIITAILVMYISKSDLTRAITNALWAFYPLCSIALFIEAVALAGMYRRITDERDKKLARYFLIAFIPQILFSIADYLLLKHISFQLTHISYTVFSILIFVDLSSYYFKHYSGKLNINDQRAVLKNRFALSDREIEVVGLLAKGIDNKTISEKLHISVNTVKSHVKRIYNKLGVSNRLQLMHMLDGISRKVH